MAEAKAREHITASRKVAYSEEAMYALLELRDDIATEILGEYKMHARRKDKGYHQKWRLVPAARIMKVWRDYGKTGLVRDERGIDEIAEIIIENILKVDVNTILCGHTQYHPEQWAAEYYGEEVPEGYFELLPEFFDDPDSSTWRISDYGLATADDARR